MQRTSTWLLGCLVLGLGIGVGVRADRWFGHPAFANGLDPQTADRLYHELKTDGTAAFVLSENLAKIARLSAPSVVHIQSERQSRRGLIEETGSGVIVRSDKASGQFVVTNRHVVDGTELTRIAIHLHDGRIVHPQKIWTDKLTDLAVLRVVADGIPAAHWGDSSKLDIGHIVLAVGSPFGLSHSVTYGILSAKGRRELELGAGSEVLNQDFLQTDAAINPGNSGGPLINLHGEVVGINTAIASNSGGNEGIGFSIPSNLVRQVVEQLLDSGKVARAYLGVKLDPEFNLEVARRLKLDRARGARVVEIYPNTPAAQAGFQFDDVILVFDGTEVVDENHLINMVSLTPINKKVQVIVQRRGQRATVDVVLRDRDELEQRSQAPVYEPGTGVSIEQLGLTVHPLTPELAQTLGFAKATTGLLVLKVDRQGPAGEDLQVYDLIEEVGRTPVSSVDDLRQVLEERGVEQVLLKVQRSQRGEVRSQVLVVRTKG